MEKRVDPHKREPKAIGGELIIPVAALLFTVYYFTTILDVPWTAQVSAFFVGTILIVLILALFVRMAMEVRRGDASLRVGRLIEPVSFIPRRIVLLALVIGYILLIGWGLGFTLTTFLFLVLAMSLLGGGRKMTTILFLSVALSVGGWLLFVVAFDTRFPAGPFELFMRRWF